MIVSSTVRIYNSNDVLIDTINVLTDAQEAVATNLSAGTEYHATAESVNDEQISSGESAPYTFYTLPNIQLTGYVNRSADGFTRPTTITTDVVSVNDWGLEYDTTSSFNNAQRVSGSNVNGLSENTTYYYRPWLEDEFGRIYVNTSSSDSVTTLYAVPQVSFAAIYGADTSMFSALINITSLTTVTSVYAELTTSGVTTTQALTAQTGQQYIYLTNLTPNTQYDCVIKAVNSAGVGVSNTIQFTTQMGEEGVVVEIIPRNLVNSNNNQITAQSVATFNPTQITITSHYVYLYTNPTHSGQADDSYDGGTNASVNAVFNNANADYDYYLFSRVEYTIGEDSFTVWSEGVSLHTYSLLTITDIQPNTNNCIVTFVVQGNSVNTELEYSEDNVTWVTIPITQPAGETITISGLNINTLYYLRGRCENQVGYCDYRNDTFTTDNIAVVNIGSITAITQTTADININITY